MTAQVADSLHHDETRWSIRAEPLRPWLRAHPDVLRSIEQACTSSMNWRGYQASWSIQDDRLMLTALRCAVFDQPDAVDAVLPLHAEWVSGEMALLLLAEHSPASELAAILTLQNGLLISEQHFAVTTRISAAGLHIIAEAPRATGLEGDDTYWGMTKKALPPVNDADHETFAGSPISRIRVGLPRQSEMPLLNDSSDRWQLRDALLKAGIFKSGGNAQ
jgi:hypothetical protein